jgi:hypothetical protein
MSSNISLNSRAQTTYGSPLRENDEFTWEVKELDLHNFKKVFGFEPAFELGDKIKKRIRNILEVEYGWSLTVEIWDYKSNLDSSGQTTYDTIHKAPADFEENVFIPTPVNEYLHEAKLEETYLKDEYEVSGNILTMRGKGPFGDRFIMEKEYDGLRGVLISEKYLSDPEGRVIVLVAGLWSIPIGNFFFGFMAIAIVGIVILMIRRKKYQAHYN